MRGDEVDFYLNEVYSAKMLVKRMTIANPHSPLRRIDIILSEHIHSSKR
jgi:hypothetical protein